MKLSNTSCIFTIAVCLLAASFSVEAGTLRGQSRGAMAKNIFVVDAEHELGHRVLNGKKPKGSSSSDEEDKEEEEAEEEDEEQEPVSGPLLRMGCDDAFNVGGNPGIQPVDFSVEVNQAALRFLRLGTLAVVTLLCGDEEFVFSEGPFTEDTRFTFTVDVPSSCRGVLGVRTSCPITLG